MSEQEIKPCPFCGKPFFIEKAINGGVTYRHSVLCVAGHDQCHSSPLQTWETVECMVEALNNRPIETVLRGEVEALRGEIAEMKARTCETCLFICYTPEHPYCREETKEGLRVTTDMVCPLWEPRKEQP